MVPSSNVRYSYVATFQNFQSSSKIELFRIILCQNSRDHRLYSPGIRNLVIECSRKIRRINYEKYAGNEERSTTDGKMECIVEGTDNSKESSLSQSILGKQSSGDCSSSSLFRWKCSNESDVRNRVKTVRQTSYNVGVLRLRKLKNNNLDPRRRASNETERR